MVLVLDTMDAAAGAGVAALVTILIVGDSPVNQPVQPGSLERLRWDLENEFAFVEQRRANQQS
jgi:hypothetical protein